MPSDRVECILCGERIPRESEELYHKMEHFEDKCICNWCIASKYLPGEKSKIPISD